MPRGPFGGYIEPSVPQEKRGSTEHNKDECPSLLCALKEVKYRRPPENRFLLSLSPAPCRAAKLRTRTFYRIEKGGRVTRWRSEVVSA